MTLLKNTAPKLVLTCLMMAAGYAQAAKAGVVIDTGRSRIETNHQGVLIQADQPPTLRRLPLNSAHPLLRKPSPTHYPVASPSPARTGANRTIYCANGSVITSQQRVDTTRSQGQMTHSQQQTTATCR